MKDVKVVIYVDGNQVEVLEGTGFAGIVIKDDHANKISTGVVGEFHPEALVRMASNFTELMASALIEGGLPVPVVVELMANATSDGTAKAAEEAFGDKSPEDQLKEILGMLMTVAGKSK